MIRIRYLFNPQGCKGSFLGKWRKILLLVIPFLLFGTPFIFAQQNPVLAEEKVSTVLPFPGAEVSRDKEFLAEKMVYLAGPETIPEEQHFHTVAPKGWQKIKTEDVVL